MAKKEEVLDLAKEARKVLLNQVELDEDGVFRVVTETRFQMWGPADGEQKIRTFGVARRDYFYNSSFNNTQAVYKTNKAISNLGREVKLISYETAAACVFKTYVFYPVFISFYENEDGLLQASFFTARSLTAFIVLGLARKRFDLATTGIISRNAEAKKRTEKSDKDEEIGTSKKKKKEKGVFGKIGENVKGLFSKSKKEDDAEVSDSYYDEESDEEDDYKYEYHYDANFDKNN